MARALAAIVLSAALSACADPHAAAPIDKLDCESCHAGRFDAVPVHATEDAPRRCYACHGTTGWYPTRHNPDRHDEFPIEREPHAGFDCWQCHVDRDLESPYNNPTVEFTCIGCHAHSAGLTSPLHSGISDYTYAAQACFRCHRRGRGDD